MSCVYIKVDQFSVLDFYRKNTPFLNQSDKVQASKTHDLQSQWLSISPVGIAKQDDVHLPVLLSLVRNENVINVLGLVISSLEQKLVEDSCKELFFFWEDGIFTPPEN